LPAPSCRNEVELAKAVSQSHGDEVNYMVDVSADLKVPDPDNGPSPVSELVVHASVAGNVGSDLFVPVGP
jgi:hypothetical protein